MAVTDEYLEYALGQLSALESVTSRRMFGGVSLYQSGAVFALIDNDSLYFKVDEGNRSDYTVQGMTPFCPFGQKGPTMSYYQVPDAVIENPNELAIWARKSVEVSLRAKRKTRKR